MNRVARSVIEELRGQHPRHVFTYRGRAVVRMHTSAWKRAWRTAGLPVDSTHRRGPHNLKHTFGRRLRAAGVAHETRKVLLGHTNGEITTHYSAPELEELLEAVEGICETDSRKSPALVVLKQKTATPVRRNRLMQKP